MHHGSSRHDDGWLLESTAPPEQALAGEDELLQRFRRTREQSVKDELVRRFLPLARSLAMRYRGGGEPSEDLMQVASVGLIAAIDRYDPARGVPFAAFASPTILGELRRHFRDRVWAMRIPRVLQERIADIEGAIGKLSAELERAPSVREIAERLGIEPGDVLEAIEAGEARKTVSLNQSPGGPGSELTPIAERLGGEDPGFELVEDRAAIRKGMIALSPIEQEVLRLRFVEGLTQSTIADRVGYSQMHVSRLIRRALERLRKVARD